MPADEQMTLERAFAELRRGVELVEEDHPGADAQRGLFAILKQAFALYRAGDEIGGADKLHDAEKLERVRN